MEISRLDSVIVNIALDELMRAAIDGGASSHACEVIASIMTPLSSINVRGQILSKMRKARLEITQPWALFDENIQALGKASVKPTGTLAENPHWNEIASLSRLALVASQQSKQPSVAQFYTPELIHIITLIAATGEVVVRSTVWGLVMDLLQSLWISRSSDAIAGSEIRLLYEEGSHVEQLKLFGLTRASRSNDLIAYDPVTDSNVLDCQEGLTCFLIRVMEAAAQSKGVSSIIVIEMRHAHPILRIAQRVASPLDELGYVVAPEPHLLLGKVGPIGRIFDGIEGQPGISS